MGNTLVRLWRVAVSDPLVTPIRRPDLEGCGKVGDTATGDLGRHVVRGGRDDLPRGAEDVLAERFARGELLLSGR